MSRIDELVEIMARLRDPDAGCPWDVKQSFATIAPYTLEEAYEVADAIERGTFGELREELGDLLFQVVFHARMAEEAGLFTFDDVVAAICDKMLRRHPHVFGDVRIGSAEEQSRAWDRHKANERGSGAGSVLDGVARALPALVRAEKLQRRAARAGFDWPDVDGPLAKCREELDEVTVALQGAATDQVADELGDLLFSCVNLARHAGIDAEDALRRASNRFARRFQAVERRLADEGRRMEDADAEALDVLWEAVKRDGA